jgi:signal transduction histidine kinase
MSSAHEELALAYFRSLRDAIVLVDRDERILLRTAEAERIGTDARIWDGADITGLFSGEPIEFPVAAPEIAQTHPRAIAEPIRDAQGAVRCVSIRLVARSVETKTAAFVRHIPGISFVKDADGRYIYCSESTWQHFRIQADELIGKSDADLWPRSIARWMIESDREVLDGRGPLRVVQTLSGPHGERKWTVYKFLIPGIDGRPNWIGGLAFDETDCATAQESAHEADKMRAISSFAGGLAHDLNNLLTVMSGYGQMLTDGLQRQAAQHKLSAHVREILSAAEKARALTDQLLAIGPRKSGTLVAVDIKQVVRELRDKAVFLAGANAELCIEEGAGNFIVKAPPGQIEQALATLVENARIAIEPATGRIIVRVGRETQVASGVLRDVVLVEVTDNGRGMDAITRQHVFEPFSNKALGKGRSLAMASVYSAIRNAGGEVTVRSLPGRGSTFTIHLPAAEEASIACGLAFTTDETSGDLRGRETILVVEDDPTVRGLVITMLEHYGYTVKVAENGKQALDLFADLNDDVSLVLTDIVMPEMNGVDLVNALSLLRPDLRFLYMTGYTERIPELRGPDQSGRGVLLKPFTAEALAGKIRAILDAEAAVR